MADSSDDGMTSPTYRDIFSKRAQAHDEAFRLYPEACRTEVGNCLTLAAPRPGEVLLDLPAAGGFLFRYLSVPDVHVIAVDPCPALHALCAHTVPDSRLAPLDDLPLADGAVDVAVCLAGLHHEPDPAAVFAEIRRVLKPGVGRLVVAEVESGSDVARFLNGFVHRYNSGGHEGRFVDPGFIGQLGASGLRLEHDEIARYHWPFASRLALGDCLQRMFGIDLASPAEIAAAVATELGIDELPDGRVGMRWSLRMLRAWRDKDQG